MQPAKILAEMKPDGTVRPSILELAAVGGSYIIVSSKGAVSDSALADRKRGMQDAVPILPRLRDCGEMNCYAR